MADRRTLGQESEQLAASYLSGQGMLVVKRNHRSASGEIDIICRDGSTLVFVEVKSRSSMVYAHPYESVGARKQERLRRLALAYIETVSDPDCEVRFDVISIVVSDGQRQIEHIRNAF